MWLSYRLTQIPHSATLRTPDVLLADALLGGALALGYAAREGALETCVGFARCFLYGLWSAAVFRMVPVMPTEGVLFYSNDVSPDFPFIVLAAAAHGAIALVFVSPLAGRVLRVEGRTGWVDEERPWHLGVATLLVFFIVAGVVRLLAA